MQFRSSKHFLFTFLLLIFPIISLAYILITAIKILPDLDLSWTTLVVMLSLALAFGILGLMIHAYRNTTYTVSKEELVYKMSFWKSKIAIDDIWLIKSSTYPSSGIRPALDWNGLKLVYGKDRVVFLSPASQDAFIALLKQKNEAIEVVL